MNPQSYNPFSYVENDPLTYTDPTGFRDGVDDPIQCVGDICSTVMIQAPRIPVFADVPVTNITMTAGNLVNSGISNQAFDITKSTSQTPTAPPNKPKPKKNPQQQSNQ
jgi:hypothetical protein